MDSFGRIDRRTMRAYWVATGFVVLIAFMGAATIIWRDYRGRIDEAGQHAMSLAQALAEHTTQIFVKLDALSHAIIEDSTNRIVDEGMLSEVLRRRAAAEPAAMGIALINGSGKVIASGMASFPIGGDMSQSADYQILHKPDAPDFYISQPYQSTSDQSRRPIGWTMSYARRIQNSDGSFGGYVLIVVDEGYLYGFYNQLDEEEGRVIGLVGEDGIIRASNVPEVIGRNIEPYLPTTLLDGQGIRIDPSVRTGIERVFAFDSSSAAPLLAYVGLPTAPIKKAWLIASSVILLALLALLAALIALGIILGKYMRGRHSLFQSMIEAAHEKQEKEFLETIVNTGEVMMAVSDTSGQIIVANKAFRHLFPATGADASQSDCLSRAIATDLDSVTRALPWQNIRSIKLDNGAARQLSWSISAIRTANGKIKNLVAAGLDITDRRAAELALYQSSKLVNLGEMATGIAHEINQPLTTLALGVDHLYANVAKGKASPDKILSDLELFSDQIERTANIVRHMRIYGRKSDGSLQTVDPADAVSGALTIVRSEIEARGIEIRVECNSGEFLVIGDLLLIEQILLNFLLNARDAILGEDGDLGRESQSIRIACELLADQQIAICVSDTGPGIPSAIIDRLFEPFFTTKAEGKGTGLGLSLSYGMARDMGGHIEASNIKNGAEFRLILKQVVTEELENEL